MTQNDRTILVVEDAANVRELVATLLRQAGYEVEEASSAQEAIKFADCEVPALVLLDVVLPDVSGYELCRTLRDRFGEALPIIFVSGTRTDPLDSVAGLLVGADDYIVKPFESAELIARVRRALTRSAELQRANGSSSSGLTPREHEVLKLLAEGLTQADIAERHGIRP